MSKYKITFSAKVWLYPGMSGWHFVYLPKKEASNIAKLRIKKVGFSFIPVVATVGTTTWRTTAFPSKNDGTYLIALKAAVRKKEQIIEHDTVHVTLVFGA